MVRYLISGMALMMIAGVATAGGEDPDKVAAICAEAEERYVERNEDE